VSRVDAQAELRRWYDATGHAHTSFLRWVGGCVGHARHDRVGADLHEPPAVAPDAQDITYLPHEAWIDGMQMTPEQMTETRRLLVQMASDARDALAGRSTLVVAFEREKSA
jgi:hypothetical protein